jgi:hypothetical protein
MSFAEDFAEWKDLDVAAYLLGRSLGLFENQSFETVKYAFWTDNNLSNGLIDALLALVRAGVLDHRYDEQFRWRRS